MKELEFSTNQARHLNELLQVYGGAIDLSHIWISRYYLDGSVIDICSDALWKEKMVQHKWYGACASNLFPQQYKYKNYEEVIWSSQIPNVVAPFDAIRLARGVNSGSNIIVQHDDFVENYGFASHDPQHKYSAKIGQYRQCYKYLTAQMKILASEIFAQPNIPRTTIHDWAPMYSVPHSSGPQYDSYPVTLFDKKVRLNQGQLTFLVLSAQGKSFQEIGKHMQLSPRSIERYAAGVRRLFGGVKLNEILAALHDSGWYEILKDSL